MQPSASESAELQRQADAGHLTACDQLAGLLFTEGKYLESSSYYLRALRGGFYKTNNRPQSEENFFRMIDDGLIPKESEAATFLIEKRRYVAEVGPRARRAAAAAGVAVFVGYELLVYAGGIYGVLRDFSLVIAVALSWGTWKLVISAFESDA